MKDFQDSEQLEDHQKAATGLINTSTKIYIYKGNRNNIQYPVVMPRTEEGKQEGFLKLF